MKPQELVTCPTCKKLHYIKIACPRCQDTDVMKPSEVQVGGDHYKKLKIQPMIYSQSNKLNFCESNIIKYATRWRDKGGLQDLLKIKHCVDMIIEIEELKK